MTTEAEFHAERLQGIGGSDCADLLELEPYGCRLKLWYDKRDIPPDFPPSAQLMRHARRGKKLEPVIGSEYAEVTGRVVKAMVKMLVHPDYPFLFNHMDFLVYEKTHLEKLLFYRYLEVKCPSYGVFKQVKDHGLKMEWICQTQQGMLVGEPHGITGAAIAVMHLDTWQMIHFDLEPDPELQEMILEGAQEFWPTVENGPSPEKHTPDYSGCRNCGYRYRCHGDLIPYSGGDSSKEYLEAPEYADLVNEVLECKDIENEAHELTEAAEGELRQALKWGTPTETGKIKVPGAAVNMYRFNRASWDPAFEDWLKQHSGVAQMLKKFRKKTPVEVMKVFRI